MPDTALTRWCARLSGTGHCFSFKLWFVGRDESELEQLLVDVLMPEVSGGSAAARAEHRGTMLQSIQRSRLKVRFATQVDSTPTVGVDREEPDILNSG